MSAAAVIVIRRKRLVRRFQAAGATAPERAITLESIHERHSWIFERMARQGVFLSAGPELFYMDEPAALNYLLAMRKRALWMTGLFLAIFLLFLLFKAALR